MRDAQHGEFNVLLAEALDRISRDLADVGTPYKHPKFAGVTIVTLAEGEISELHDLLHTPAECFASNAIFPSFVQTPRACSP